MYLKCDNPKCGKEFSRKNSSIAKNKLHFCCRDCYHEYRRLCNPKYDISALKQIKIWAKKYEQRN